MTPTRSGSPSSTGARADVRTRPRAAPVAPPSELQPELRPPSELQPELRPPTPAEPVVEPVAVGPAVAEQPPLPTPTPPPTSTAPPRPEERRALRAARRRRRQLAIGCAVVVAFCLGVTILIVVMAGNRTPGAQAVTPLPPASAASAAPLHVVPGTAGLGGWGRA
jgi:hypothetical protein